MLKNLQIKIYSIYNHITHTLWLIGNLPIQICKNNPYEFSETIYWLLIHFQYKGNMVSKNKLKLKQIIVNNLQILLGILTILFVINYIKIIILLIYYLTNQSIN
jgi:uncharacterized membrane protein SpoIIM required for sporulation